MIGKAFINDIVNKAIENYLKYKSTPQDEHFFDFPVMAIRTLIYIYGELDIINPYITQNEHNLGGFDNNLTKYGFSLEKLQDFKNQFLKYTEDLDQNKNPNYGFLNLEKYLIDMYFCKKKSMHLTDKEDEEFKSWLYLEENQNPYIQRDINNFCTDKTELAQYFQSISFETSHNFNISEFRTSILLPEAYQIFGYSLEQISQLNDIDLRNMNNQIYNFFRVDANDENRDSLLQKAVNYYKKYGNRVTSGNGYVDFLLFASILATAIFIVLLMTFNLL